MNARLAYLCSSESWGGLEMNHLRNAVWMKERGHFVVMVCIDNSRLAREAVANEIPVLYIEKHKKYYDFAKGKILAKLLRDQGITHLIIRSTYDISITAIVKRKLGNQIHTSYFMEMQLGLKKTNILHTIRFKGIDLWSCPLNWLKTQVETMTHFKNGIVVIPSGLELSRFETATTVEEARGQLEIPENTVILGLIGRFDPQKGQLLLLEAMKRCSHKDFHILLLGEPTFNEGEEYYNEMLSMIENNHLQHRVHIRPFMKDINVFYTAVDWFVMATKAETFGMVTIESLASGTPVLGSNAGGTPEILDHEQGGLLFETMNASDLARQIDRICEEKIKYTPDDLKRMAQKYDHRSVCELVENALGIN